jgi:hypothetical protein
VIDGNEMEAAIRFAVRLAIMVVIGLVLVAFCLGRAFAAPLNIQATIDAGEPVTLPAGVHELANTITIPSRFGHNIKGVGVSPPENQNRKATTTLLWTGPAGQPMFRILGAHVQFEGIGLDCNKRANCGLQFAKDPSVKNYASGKFECSSIPIAYPTEAGIICGESLGDHHCDTILIGNYWAWHCPRALLVRNAQSMVHRFGYVHLFGTPIGFSYNAGGCLDCEMVFAAFGPTTILRVNGGPGFGRGNADWKIDYVKGDKQAAVTLIETQGTTFDATIAVNRARLDTPAATLVKASGPVAITLRDVLDVPSRSIQMTPTTWVDKTGKSYTAAPFVTLTNCRINPKQPSMVFAEDFKGCGATRDCSVWPSTRLGNWTGERK